MEENVGRIIWGIESEEGGDGGLLLEVIGDDIQMKSVINSGKFWVSIVFLENFGKLKKNIIILKIEEILRKTELVNSTSPASLNSFHHPIKVPTTSIYKINFIKIM